MADTKQKKNQRLHEPKTPTTLEKFNLPKAEIQKVLKESEKLVITDNSSYKVVKSVRTNIKAILTTIEKTRQVLRKAVLAKSREDVASIDGIAEEYGKNLLSRRKELDENIGIFEEKAAEEKAKKERLKALRLKVIRDVIKEWKKGFEYDPKITVADLQANIQAIRDKVFPKKMFEELVPEAELERGILLGQLGNILALREEAERKEAKDKAERMKVENERLAQELANAKEQYNNVFGHYPEPDDLTLIQLKSITARRIQEMRENTAPIAKVPGKMTTPIETSGDHEKEIAVKGTPPGAGNSGAMREAIDKANEATVDPGYENDKKKIKDKMEEGIQRIKDVGIFNEDLSLESDYWRNIFEGWQIGVGEVVLDRFQEMLEQVQ